MHIDMCALPLPTTATYNILETVEPKLDMSNTGPWSILWHDPRLWLPD